MGRGKSRRSVGDYFMAAVGVGLLLFILAIVLTPGSCQVRLDLDADKPWVTPTPLR